MKIGIISDLHLDFGYWYFRPAEYDVDVWLNAGDTCDPPFHGRFYDTNYFWTLGNHDFYGKKIWEPEAYCESVEIYGVKIAMAPLWTDLSQGADWPNYITGLIDYRYMVYGGWNFETYVKHHAIQREFLLNSGADIIMSHHAPSYASVNKKYIGDAFNASFATELSNDILDLPKKPKLWIHGHMHDPVDYMIGETRVVSNPRGYRGESNYADYKPLILEV